MSKSNDPCRTPVHRSTLRASAISAGDDSPTLSQEPMKVTWEWNRENTPVRSTAGSSKLKSDRWSKRSPINSNLYRASITSSASKKKMLQQQRPRLWRIRPKAYSNSKRKCEKFSSIAMKLIHVIMTIPAGSQCVMW